MDLPPLIEDEKRRRKIEATIRLTRDRYRQFRSRLSDELQSQKFLPPDLKKKVISELDKRLDLDIGQVLGSPKLRLKLSPGEEANKCIYVY